MTEAETKAYNRGIYDAADVVDKLKKGPHRTEPSLALIHLMTEISLTIRKKALIT